MSQVFDNARAKVKEAQFFLNLMNHVEHSQTPVVQGSTAKDEYVWFLSAFLNACYSATEHLEGEAKLVPLVKAFQKKHQGVYGHDGWRTTAVHFQPVVPEFKGYIPPPGNKVNFKLKKFTPSSGHQVNFDLSKGSRFYFTGKAPQSPIDDLCEEHLAQVRDFIMDCEKKIP